MSISSFLNTGINRKQYILLLLLGIILSPLSFIASILLHLYVNSFFDNQKIGMGIAMLYFLVIGAYFYVIKMKRLQDIGRGNDTLLGAHMVPGGDIALNAVLLGKKLSILQIQRLLR